MAQFKIHLTELETGGKDYSFSIDEAWLRAALDDTDLAPSSAHPDGEVQVRAQLSGREVLVHGRVRQTVNMTCSRCLEDTPLSVDVEIGTLFAPRGSLRPMREDEELNEDDLQREEFSGDVVELDALVREHIVLEAPMQPRCSEECPGIEVPDGVKGSSEDRIGPDGKVVDPRFAALLNIKLPEQKLPD